MAEAAARTGMIDWKKAFARTDLALALGVVCMLVILIMPMPTWLMDFNLALSITFSALVLMTAIFIEKTLEFTSFPFILLITTMFRLSLNLASTRLILANGHRGTNAAGHVIEAFGGFVMGGNFVIGVIVFAILIVVNFMVITKGSTRIAEVAARFTLDAMPGKQMAIDADLSSGLIDEDEARRRRDDLGRESSFFGAMDGASKFVRGDAIAGLIITLINIIAGLVIGMAQKGLSFSQASDFYIRLTVGDGLVSQIPALVISMAAGIVVSKAGMMNKSTDKVLFGQLAFYPKALGMSSFLGAALAVLPGTPAMPFLSLAALSGFGAWYIDRSQRQAKRAADDKKEAASKSVVPAAEEPASAALKMDQISLMLGYGLLPLVTDGTRSIPDQIKVLRRGLAKDLGFIMPSIRIADNMALPANEYVIYIKEVEAGRGELRPNMLLAMNSSGSFDLPGEKTFEPAFGQPALWVDPMYKEDAMFRGYTVVDASMVMTTHLIEVIKANMSDLLSYSETQKLLDEIGKENQKLVSEIVPGRMGVGGIQRVLQNLLAERVSVRDLPAILEGVAEIAGTTHNLDAVGEHVRARLSRQISAANVDAGGVMHLVALSPEWEQKFSAGPEDGEGAAPSLSPTDVQRFASQIRQTFDDLSARGVHAVLMTSPAVRLCVRQIVERFNPSLPVVSQREIHPKVKVRMEAQI